MMVALGPVEGKEKRSEDFNPSNKEEEKVREENEEKGLILPEWICPNSLKSNGCSFEALAIKDFLSMGIP